MEMGGVAWLLVCGIISFLAIAITSYYINIENHTFPLLLYAGPVYLWIIFFMLGIWIRRNPYKSFLTVGIILVGVGFVAEIVETCFYMSLNGKGLGIKLSSFMFSAGVILTLMSDKIKSQFQHNAVTRFVAWIGGISFGVYLIHTYIIWILHRYLISGNWLISWGVTTVISLVVLFIMRKLIPNKIRYKLFGF